MFEVSCCWTVGFCWFSVELEPTVSPGFAAGPFLFPGWPAMPAPEFCALGAPETSGFAVWARAAGAESARANTSALTMDLMMNPPFENFGSAECGHLQFERAVTRRVPLDGVSPLAKGLPGEERRTSEFATMARYCFDTRDDEAFIPDDVGVEIDSFDQVKLAASTAMADFAKTYYPGSEVRNLAIEVPMTPCPFSGWPFASRSST